MADHVEPPPQELLIKGRRRAPKYSAFIATGVIVGVLAALIVTTFTPRDAAYSYSTAFGYIGTLFVLVGGLIGGLVAVILDRKS